MFLKDFLELADEQVSRPTTLYPDGKGQSHELSSSSTRRTSMNFISALSTSINLNLQLGMKSSFKSICLLRFSVKHGTETRGTKNLLQPKIASHPDETRTAFELTIVQTDLLPFYPNLA